jgi:uncharacterized protein (DUF3820 family)
VNRFKYELEDDDRDIVLPFGKYRGKTLKEVDPAYLAWLIETIKPEGSDDGQIQL